MQQRVPQHVIFIGLGLLIIIFTLFFIFGPLNTEVSAPTKQEEHSEAIDSQNTLEQDSTGAYLFQEA